MNKFFANIFKNEKMKVASLLKSIQKSKVIQPGFQTLGNVEYRPAGAQGGIPSYPG